MIIAIPYENEQVFQHFGRKLQFKIYYIENNEITDSQIIDACGQGHSALSKFLFDYQVDIVICGGIGSGARNALKSFDIQLYSGVIGNCDEVIENYLTGNLVFNPNIQCSCHK